MGVSLIDAKMIAVLLIFMAIVLSVDGECKTDLDCIDMLGRGWRCLGMRCQCHLCSRSKTGENSQARGAALEKTTESLASVAKRTIVVWYNRASSGDLNVLTKKEIENLENNLRNKYCKERGCEINQHMTFVGAIILRYKSLKSQSDEVKHLNSLLPPGAVAKADRVTKVDIDV